MNFVKRALINVKRKMSKTILLTLTFFLIGNLVLVGLGIANASESAKTLTRKKMRAVVTYQIDYEAFYKFVDSLEDEQEIQEYYSKKYPKITLEEVQDLLKDERVKTANALSTSMFYKADDGIEFVRLNNKAEENGYYESTPPEDYYSEWGYYQESCFTVKANYFPNMIEFIDGGFSIEEGRFYNQEEIDNAEHVVVISRALADLNGLKVGDSIKFNMYTDSDLYYFTKDTGIVVDDDMRSMEAKIIGIFNHQSPITPDNDRWDWISPYENPDNMMFMPSTSVLMAQLPIQQLQYDYYASLYPEEEYYSPENRPTEDNLFEKAYIYNVTLLLDDPLKVDDFIKDYEGSLSEFKKLDADNSEFERLAKPLNTLNLYANFIIWLVVINAVVIITLVTALTLKNREYEIGVLLSIGATKLKVILQFFIELALVAVIGFTLAIGSGSLITKQVGNKILEYQISYENSQESSSQVWYDDGYSIWDNDYTTDITMEDMIAEYDASISLPIIIEIYVLGLAIVMVSILIPSAMIMRFNPKRILTNQG